MPLIPFEATHAPPGFSLRGDFQVVAASQELILTFEIPGSLHIKGVSTDTLWGSENSIARADELWRSTCFELFLQPEGGTSYYEFNFTLTPAWNVYFFADYRTPQPPESTEHFHLQKLEWDGRFLNVKLSNRSGHQKFQGGLTAVIEDSKNQLSYFALKHAGQKPDFHLAASFILQRG